MFLRMWPHRSSSQLRLKPSNQLENPSEAPGAFVALRIGPMRGMFRLRLTRAVRRGRLLGLGEDVAHGDRLAGPGLEDPCARDPQSRVLLVSRDDQGVERRILEDLPPVLQVVILDAGIIRLDPFRSHGPRRPGVVGPDLEAIVNPLPGAGRDAASAVEQDHADQGGQREPAARRGTAIRSLPRPP